MPEALFNISRFLMTETSQTSRPRGVSLFAILYCLSKQARKLGANKLAKQILDKIQTLKIPQKFQEQVEIASIAARARPYSDPEELLPMCYRCSTYNPLASASNRCVNCGQKFVHSYVSFGKYLFIWFDTRKCFLFEEILPLVEFMLQEGITDVEAVRLIETPPSDVVKGENWKQEMSEGGETLQLDVVEEEKDPFTARLGGFESGAGDGSYFPVTVNRKTLLAMESTSVLICKWNPPLRYQFFKNLLPELQITMCYCCFKAFHVDDFELQLLQKGYCPFCRAPPENSLSSDSADDLLV
jgi:intraflagellar transport protein 122